MTKRMTKMMTKNKMTDMAMKNRAFAATGGRAIWWLEPEFETHMLVWDSRHEIYCWHKRPQYWDNVTVRSDSVNWHIVKILSDDFFVQKQQEFLRCCLISWNEVWLNACIDRIADS